MEWTSANIYPFLEWNAGERNINNELELDFFNEPQPIFIKNTLHTIDLSQIQKKKNQYIFHGKVKKINIIISALNRKTLKKN